jgi:hypothetical protein
LSTRKKNRIFSIFIGASSIPVTSFKFNDFKQIYPLIYPEFESDKYRGSGFYYNFNLGIRSNVFSKRNALFRCGFEISTKSLYLGSIDTSYTSSFYGVDESGNYHYEYSYDDYELHEFQNTSFSADVSLILRTKPEKRFSFYYGTGLQIGLNSYKTEEYYSYQTYYNVIEGDIEFENDSGEGTYYSKARMGFVISPNFPFGLDFRVGNKKNALRHWHMFAEIRPEIGMNYYKELNSFRLAGIASFKFIGFKYVFDKYQN